MLTTTMALSNVQYSELKQKSGLHNWGFASSRRNKFDFDFDFDMDELDDVLDGLLILDEFEE